MINIRSGSKIVRLLFSLTAVVVFLATSAAAADIHYDFGYHKDCVLCQLAQLALTAPTTGIELPVPVMFIAEFTTEATAWIHSSVSSPFSTRGPPA
jgi:hypothetical protein